MNKESRSRFSGADVQAMFADNSVAKLEAELRTEEVELARLESDLDKEVETDALDVLLDKIREQREVLSGTHRRLVNRQREFTDIARGQGRS